MNLKNSLKMLVLMLAISCKTYSAEEKAGAEDLGHLRELILNLIPSLNSGQAHGLDYIIKRAGGERAGQAGEPEQISDLSELLEALKDQDLDLSKIIVSLRIPGGAIKEASGLVPGAAGEKLGGMSAWLGYLGGKLAGYTYHSLTAAEFQSEAYQQIFRRAVENANKIKTATNLIKDFMRQGDKADRRSIRKILEQANKEEVQRDLVTFVDLLRKDNFARAKAFLQQKYGSKGFIGLSDFTVNEFEAGDFAEIFKVSYELGRTPKSEILVRIKQDMAEQAKEQAHARAGWVGGKAAEIFMKYQFGV